jgi:hypothetical protein
VLINPRTIDRTFCHEETHSILDPPSFIIKRFTVGWRDGHIPTRFDYVHYAADLFQNDGAFITQKFALERGFVWARVDEACVE